MNLWFTREDAPLERTWVKRFDPLHWTVDYPAGASASLVTGGDGHSLNVEASFLRKGDLVGLIFESRDRRAHPAHARVEGRDYSGCVLKFRWVAEGLMPLDAANGATLTIEGEDAGGAVRSWYVRLWNYAVGSASDAVMTLDFDALDAGYSLPGERIFVRSIKRLFISLVPPDYVSASGVMRVAAGRVSVTDIRCDGPGSTIAINDCVVPELPVGICTAYDDCYDLPPERIVASAERLGYRGTINHYIGMSHYSTLGADGMVDASVGMNAAALAWHRELARAAKAHGFELIWSLSFELPESRCPAAWAQRTSDGAKGLTAYDPPSVLLSPASGAAMGYLQQVAGQLVGLSVEAGLTPRLQVGEPWWWVTAQYKICLYDDAARAALGGSPVLIGDIRGGKSAAEKALLDAAGVLLANATAGIFAAAKAVSAATVTHVLVYLPGPLDPASPEVRRANLPMGWASPAADVLQLEDYEWVTGGADARRRATYAAVGARLGYGPGDQHYLSGFAAAATARADWRAIVAAADEARGRGVAEVLLWAMPQVMRDGLTLFAPGGLGGEAEMNAFDEVDFPIAIGAEASVAPGFSTNVVTSASGHEFRNANWASARLRFDAGPGVRGDAELETLIAFFRARRGSAVGFRFRDPYDFSSGGMTGAVAVADQALGVGDGVRTRFELVKHYGDEERRITRPVAGSVRVSVGGVEAVGGWTVEAGGVLLFDAAPAVGAVVAAGYLFDVPVRFGEDRLEINRASFLAGAAPSVPLIEVREG